VKAAVDGGVKAADSWWLAARWLGGDSWWLPSLTF